jgi:hypothetical protein
MHPPHASATASTAILLASQNQRFRGILFPAMEFNLIGSAILAGFVLVWNLDFIDLKI